MELVAIDTSCLGMVNKTHGEYVTVCTARYTLVRMQSDGHLRAFVDRMEGSRSRCKCGPIMAHGR